MAVEDTDFLFPPKVMPELRDVRGLEWKSMVDRISLQAPDAIERVAFVLMMVRMNGCTTCQADSFKAMRGCSSCSVQTVKRFRGDDKELINQLEVARRELVTYMKKQGKK